MKLTKTDREILNSYILTIKGMGAFLGSGYELILYSLEDQSIVMIVNGEHSSRKIGDPIAEKDLTILEKAKNMEEDNPYLVYFSRNSSGEPMKSMITPIEGSNQKIIGVLCINFYLNTSFVKVMGTFLPEHNSSQKAPVIDSFSEDPQSIILESLQEAKTQIEGDTSIPATEKNKAIIEQLLVNGIFQIKNSVVIVADLLSISKNTVYLHIRNYKNKHNH
ncbi:PAS domain-containing protein [Paenibacillus sp. M1]|uniref:PAS domain-containing protein n=1 Tax=Paenibacillus haidiansis TaxID=1574488 RepID=A0ABU7VY19_9BACL